MAARVVLCLTALLFCLGTLVAATAKPRKNAPVSVAAIHHKKCQFDCVEKWGVENNVRKQRGECFARCQQAFECSQRCEQRGDLAFTPPDNKILCGTDGNIYRSACQAKCVAPFGVVIRGKCDAPKSYFGPVCGSDRVTYSHPCEATCKSLKYKKGACKDPALQRKTCDEMCANSPNKAACQKKCRGRWQCAIKCSEGSLAKDFAETNTVRWCGNDGELYHNLCELMCQKALPLWSKSCEAVSVCGVNGVTYRSACHAECNLVKVRKFGQCILGDSIQVISFNDDDLLNPNNLPAGDPNSRLGK